MFRFRLALAITATVAAVAFGAFGGRAGAAPATVTLSPNPAASGAAVLITVTVDNYGPCNNGIVRPPGSPFDSTIELYDAGHNLVATGSFPGGTSVGTLLLPPGTTPGTYNVEVSCAVSLGNGVFFPTNALTVNAATLPPVLIDDPSTSRGSGGAATGARADGTAIVEAPAAAPVAAVPRVTG